MNGLLSRLVVVLLVVLASAGVARADYPADMSGATQYQHQFNDPATWFASKEAACDHRYATMSDPPAGGLVVNGLRCDYAVGGYLAAFLASRVAPKCPYGGTYTTTGNMCIGGTPPPPVCTAGAPYTIHVKFPRDSLFPKVDGGCVVAVDEIVSCYHPTSGPEAYVVNYCTFKVHKTGVVASGTPAPGTPTPVPAPTEPTAPAKMPPTLAPDTQEGGACPFGSVAGGIDSRGTTICVGTGTAPGPAASTTTQGPPIQSTTADGSTVTKQITTTKNTDGSVTTMISTVTTAPDGTTTSEKSGTTSMTPAGANGKFDSDPDNKNDFCKMNPMLSVCRNSTVSGTCEAISCEGDAIQCAVLRANAAMECRDKKDRADLAATPAHTLGTQIAAGNDPMKSQIDAAIAGTEVDMSSPNLDASGFIGGESCIGNKTFTFLGRAVPVSFTAACDSIQPLRYVILAAAYIFAYLIVSKSVLST